MWMRHEDIMGKMERSEYMIRSYKNIKVYVMNIYQQNIKTSSQRFAKNWIYFLGGRLSCFLLAHLWTAAKFRSCAKRTMAPFCQGKAPKSVTRNKLHLMKYVTLWDMKSWRYTNSSSDLYFKQFYFIFRFFIVSPLPIPPWLFSPASITFRPTLNLFFISSSFPIMLHFCFLLVLGSGTSPGVWSAH